MFWAGSVLKFLLDDAVRYYIIYAFITHWGRGNVRCAVSDERFF